MKTLDSNSLLIQKNNNAFIVENIFLYKLFEDNVVFSIISNASLGMTGDLTADILVDDLVCFPTALFGTDLTVVTISYDVLDDLTTITFAQPLITTEFLNQSISIKIDITDRLLIDGIKDTVQKIEGVDLNNFDSGKLDFEVDNSDGYFSNRNKTGLIDAGNIFFAKYIIKFKAAYTGGTDLIYFGGILSITDSQPDYYNKTYIFRILGHSAELERYAAFNVTDTTTKELPKISGIEIVEYTPVADSEVGIKQINYYPFVTDNPMSGISFVSVSIDTEPGIKKLEFRYPNAFKWDNGDWTDVVNTGLDADGNKVLYAKGGSGSSLFAYINFGKQNELNTFPDRDMEIWVLIKENVIDAGDKVVSEYGEPKISFDGGSEESITVNFARVIKYDVSLTTYLEVTDSVNEGYKSDPALDMFDAVNDWILIIAPNKFWAMEFLLSPGGEGDAGNSYDIQYSQGGQLFSNVMTFGNSGLVDGTLGFTQSGIIKWNELDNWTIGNIDTADGESYKGYIIRIINITRVDTPKLKELKKVLRLRGKNGDFLQVKFFQNKAYTKSESDEVIIKDVQGTLTPAVWYQNITIKQLLEITMDEANYTANNRYLTDVKIIKTDRYFNIWGKPPKRNYQHNPSGIVVDSIDDYIYISAKTEIWRCHITGTWELVVAVEYPYPIPEKYMFIKKFWISKDDGLIYIYSEYIKKPDLPYVAQFSYVGYLHSYDLLTKTLTLVNSTSYLYDGLRTIRNGCVYWNGASYTNVIGHGWNNPYGGSISINRGSENLCVPFEQILRPYRGGDHNMTCAIMIDLADDLSGYFSFLFHSIFNDGGLLIDKNGPEYKATNSYYCIEDGNAGSTSKMHLLIDYNQKGMLIVVDKIGTDADLYIIKQHEDSGSTPCWYLYSLKNVTKLGWKTYDEGHHPICHHYDINNELFYLGYVMWGDRATTTALTDGAIPAYSYITKLKLSTKLMNFDRVNVVLGASIINVTTDINAGNSTTVFQASGDRIDFGSSKKFRQIYVNLESNANTYAYEYWNGSNWVAFKNVGNGFKDYDKIVSWDMPEDWVQISDGYFYGWWMRIRCTSFSAEPTLTNIELRESVLWDSQLDNSGDLDRYMPTWFVLDEIDNTIHGCLFNRQSTDNFPYQWCYFVLDLNDGILYVSRTGDNYNFDASYSYKDFIFNQYDKKVYCYAESIRHKEKIGFLVRGEYDLGTHVITLTKEGEPRKKEWGNVELAHNDINGNIFGISRGNEYSLWEYSKEFYQRIEVADFSSDENVRNIISELSLFANCVYMIHSERFIRFIKRDEYNGTIDLTWDENVQTQKPDVVNWEHFFDAIKVEYKSLTVDDNGDRKAGYTGWLKKIMNVNNILIQNEHIAKLVADNLYEFYNNYRMNIKDLKTIPLIQIELLDKFNLYMPASIIDLDETTDFIVTGVSKKSNFDIVLEGLEKIAPPAPEVS